MRARWYLISRPVKTLCLFCCVVYLSANAPNKCAVKCILSLHCHIACTDDCCKTFRLCTEAGEVGRTLFLHRNKS